MILLSPFVVVFVYPVVLVIMMYGSAVFLHVYRHRRREIYDAYTENFWDGAMQTVAAVFDSHGSLWHGKCSNLSMLFFHVVLLCKCEDLHVSVFSFYYFSLKKKKPCARQRLLELETKSKIL